MVNIPVEGGGMPTYQAMPARGGPFPVVLVAHQIFGVNGHMQDVCRRLACLGYLALAPDLFWRQGDVSAMTDHREILDQVVARVPDRQAMSDLDAAAAFVSSGPGDPGRLGLAGFSWGGRMAWLYAAHSDRLRAAVSWCGHLAGDTVEVAGRLGCPVLGLYGALDEGIPLAQVEGMRKALAAIGRDSEIVLYPEAGHAFHADGRPSYHEASAADGWARMVEWFRRYGVA
jgi:carboxymethylenebutenolidase